MRQVAERNLILYEEEKKSNSDHVATPVHVVESIYKFLGIEKFKSIWLPFDHFDSSFKLVADKLKLNYKATHVFDDFGNDFFKTDPPADCDLMISNPPFSKQNAIIKRSFELAERGGIKSFCLLLPLSTLETAERAETYERYLDKLSILFLKRRIKFVGHESNFGKGCCWICYNIEALLENRIYWI